MADRDLDEQFALFERQIQSVSKEKTKVQVSPELVNSKRSPRFLPSSSSSAPSRVDASQSSPKRIRENILVPIAQPHFHWTGQTAAKSSSTSHVSNKAAQASESVKNANDRTTSATAGGRWKWDGSAWKWQLTAGPTPPPTAASRVARLSRSVPPVRPSPASHPPPAAHGATLFGPVAPVVKPPLKRTAAGEVWVDETLTEWPANDHRIFVGDLAPDAQELDLQRAFSRYKSYNMAKVVRDKRSGLCKGYGFVSFAAGEDMVAALKEMNGKYIGARPVKLKKSNWEKRTLSSERRKELKLLRGIVKRR